MNTLFYYGHIVSQRAYGNAHSKYFDSGLLYSPKIRGFLSANSFGTPAGEQD